MPSLFHVDGGDDFRREVDRSRFAKSDPGRAPMSAAQMPWSG
jgi:hypothetical protein